MAREFVAALPVELDRDAWVKLLSDFIQEQFVADGMCADVAIHDTDGHNPHAHIMLTVRPLTDKGIWQQKTQKEYLCVRGNEERGFTAAEFQAAKKEGWEKQYQCMVHGKKVWMTESYAKDYGWWTERVSKYPKSSKFGRQNPITERWNSEEQLTAWREAWAIVVNRVLEQAGYEERIDHRSNTARGIDEQPTVHEGVAARVIEKQGFTADRCELNRQIREDNRILRSVKAAISKMADAVKKTVPTIADALETIRANMIFLRFMANRYRGLRYWEEQYLKEAKEQYSKYQNLRQTIREKQAERKKLQQENDALSAVNVFKRRELTAQIAELSEEIEELRNEETTLIRSFEKKDAVGMKVVESEMQQSEKRADSYWESERKYSRELTTEKQKFMEMKDQAKELDRKELITARMTIRPEKEQVAVKTIRKSIKGDPYEHQVQTSKDDVDKMLDEEFMEIRYQLEHKDELYERKGRTLEWER